MPTHLLETLIDASFERRAEITPRQAQPELVTALDQIVADLNAGQLRVAEKINGEWITHQWVKKAVLLYFRVHDNQTVEGGAARRPVLGGRGRVSDAHRQAALPRPDA